MAMFDDRAFLIMHIRNSFITSDDTGMSELILECDDALERHMSISEKRPISWPRNDFEEIKGGDSFSPTEADIELSHSCDIYPDMDFSGHRRRSNTAQRLEKLQLEKHAQSKIKHIQWKNVKNNVSDYSEHFEAKDLNVVKSDAPRKSLLALQLEQYSSNNPFMEFAKYDGRTVGGIPTKKIDIYLTMAPPNERSYPMPVVTIASAKVQHLIGLIQWQYTMEKREPPLIENSEAYTLHMVEDDGEVDMDFPPLDNREPISKFGFTKLALVEKPVISPSQKTLHMITVEVPGQNAVTFTQDTEMLVKELLEKVLAERVTKRKRVFSYRLERRTCPGIALDPELPVSTLGTTEFCLVRENSRRNDEPQTGVNEIDDALSSHHYKSFTVTMHNRLGKTDVQLGICGEKIEIDPTTANGHFRRGSLTFRKLKPVVYNIDVIAACTLQDGKSSDRSAFRLVHHSSNEFKNCDFECDLPTAKEIVTKINNILEMRLSSVRRDYLRYKQPSKLSQRHTFLL